MGLFLKDWFEKASVGWGHGERGGEIFVQRSEWSEGDWGGVFRQREQ